MTAVNRSALTLLIAVGVIGFLILLLGPIAKWATLGANQLAGKDKSDAVNTTRQILLAAAGGTAVLIGLGFTARTYYLSKRGQFTDRYTKAIAQLASEKLTERLGGIYALEHLMRESASDHATVVAVLAAFVRERAPADPAHVDPAALAAQQPGPRPETDVQAALTVLARRPERPEPDHLDLSSTDLRGADLRWARLEGARLGQTWFHYANLSGAHLKSAFLRGAQFQHAWLVGAELEDVDLIDAQLEQANMGGAQLRNADLRRALLRKAHLRHANLKFALLSGACLEDAYLVDAQLQNACLAGSPIGSRVNVKSSGYHPDEEKKQEVYLGGANLEGANLEGADLRGTNLASDPFTHKQEPVQGLTVTQLAQAVHDESTLVPDSLRQAPSAAPASPPTTSPIENPSSPGTP